jgi:hypothetical protein
MGNRWGREKGNREEREGEGGQCTANQGSEWMGIRATSQRRDFQVSKRGVQEIRVGVSKQRGLSKGLGMHLPISCQSCIYRANKRLCLGYK